MRVVASITLDEKIAQWLKKKARATGHSVSTLVNYYLQNAMHAESNRQNSEHKMIECSNCKAKYSDALNECPKCHTPK